MLTLGVHDEFAKLRTADAGIDVIAVPRTGLHLDRNRALHWLERYEVRRDMHFQAHLRCDPPFDAIQNDRRFQAQLTLPRPPVGQGC